MGVTQALNSAQVMRGLQQNAQFGKKFFMFFCAKFYLTFLQKCGIME